MEVQSGFKNEAHLVPSPLFHNKALLSRLADTAAAGRLCHAYLLYGEKGIGKRTFARHFAAAILCRHSGTSGGAPADEDAPLLPGLAAPEPLPPEQLPCYECTSCRKAMEGNHPDIILYEGKRGANALHIDIVRGIRQEAYILPNESRYKIYILPNVEDMTSGAANAFLKVLEEPPPHVVFLLTADNPEMVMETIRSRCILQELYPMADGELVNAVRAMHPERGPSELEESARMADGILGRALEVLDSGDYQEIMRLSGRLEAGLASRNEYEVLAALNDANQNKERFLLLLSCFSHQLRAALLDKLSGRASADPKTMAFRLTAVQMEQVYALLEQARGAVNGNANLGLLTNYLSLGMMQAVGQRG